MGDRGILAVLGLTVMVPLLVIIFVVQALSDRSKRAERGRLLTFGMPADGRVVTLTNWKSFGLLPAWSGLAEVDVTVEVALAGHAPYTVYGERLVRREILPSLQPGAYVALRVDPADPRKLTLV